MSQLPSSDTPGSAGPDSNTIIASVVSTLMSKQSTSVSGSGQGQNEAPATTKNEVSSPTSGALSVVVSTFSSVSSFTADNGKPTATTLLVTQTSTHNPSENQPTQTVDSSNQNSNNPPSSVNSPNPAAYAPQMVSETFLQFNLTSKSFSAADASLKPNAMYGASVLRLGGAHPNSDASLVIGGKADNGWISTNQVVVWAFDSWAIFSTKNSAKVDARTNPLLVPVRDTNSLLLPSSLTTGKGTAKNSATAADGLNPIKKVLVIGGTVNGHDALPYAASIGFNNVTGWVWNTSIPQTLFDEKRLFGAVSFGTTLITLSHLAGDQGLTKRDGTNGLDIQYIDTDKWVPVNDFTPVNVQNPGTASTNNNGNNNDSSNDSNGALSTGGKIALSTVLPISGVVFALVGIAAYRHYKSKQGKYEQYDQTNENFIITNTTYHLNRPSLAEGGPNSSDLHKTSSIRSWQEKLRKYQQAVVGSAEMLVSHGSPFNDPHQQDPDTSFKHNNASNESPEDEHLRREKSFNTMHAKAHLNNLQQDHAQQQSGILKRMGTLLSNDGILGKRRKWSLNLHGPMNGSGSGGSGGGGYHAHMYANERSGTLKNGKRSPLLHQDEAGIVYSGLHTGSPITEVSRDSVVEVPSGEGSGTTTAPGSLTGAYHNNGAATRTSDNSAVNNANDGNDTENEDDNDIFEGRDVQVLVSSRRRTRLRVTNPDPSSTDTTPDVSRNNSEKSSLSLSNVVNSSLTSLTHALIKKKSKLGSLKSSLSNKSNRSLTSMKSFKSANSGNEFTSEELERLRDAPDSGVYTNSNGSSGGLDIDYGSSTRLHISKHDSDGDGGDIALTELHELEILSNLEDLPEEPEDTDSLLAYEHHHKPTRTASFAKLSLYRNSSTASLTEQNVTNLMSNNKQGLYLGRRNTTLGLKTDFGSPLVVRKTRRTSGPLNQAGFQKGGLEDVEEEEKSRAVSTGSSFMQIV